MENLFEYKKLCKCGNKILPRQLECLDCQAARIKLQHSRKTKINIVDYFCKKSGGVFEPGDFKMFAKKG